MASRDTARSLDLDALLDRISAGESLSADELTRAAESPDILPIGMMADAVRRRIHGARVTFLRVAGVDEHLPVAHDVIPPAAREVRLTGSPETLALAVGRVVAVRTAAGERSVSGFSWTDVDRWATANGGYGAVLKALRQAGLDAVAELSLDLESTPERALDALAEAGFRGARLTIANPAPILERLRHFQQAASLCERFPDVAALAPLPLSLNPHRPTTGYDDVKAVALARLTVPRVPHVQVDWLRYGPKLAQVALTFGADDLDNVSSVDDAPDGRRRAAVEELRKNVESAGFTAAERDGRFAILS